MVFNISRYSMSMNLCSTNSPQRSTNILTSPGYNLLSQFCHWLLIYCKWFLLEGVWLDSTIRRLAATVFGCYVTAFRGCVTASFQGGRLQCIWLATILLFS